MRVTLLFSLTPLHTTLEVRECNDVAPSSEDEFHLKTQRKNNAIRSTRGGGWPPWSAVIVDRKMSASEAISS